MMPHRDIERCGGLAGEAQQGIAVRAVVRDLKFDDRIVRTHDVVDVLADGAVLVVQNPDAVLVCVRHIVLRQTQLLERAEHAAGLHAAELALRDMHAAGEPGIVLRHGHKVALVDVLRAGHDLDGLLRADVDHADPHVVGIFMPRHREHLADDDIFDLGVHARCCLNLLTGNRHDLVVFAVSRLNIYKLFEPVSRNIHRSALLKTATGSGCRFRRSCAGR